MEDGRICNDLCWDEMLGVIARITLGESAKYPMITIDEHKEIAKKRALSCQLHR
jgi:hypothetical protein